VTWYGRDDPSNSNDDWAREIFLYDGTTTTGLTDNTYMDNAPRISGSNVVWEASVDGEDSEVLLYDGVSTTRLTDNDGQDRYPEVSGSNVVWQGYTDGSYEVFQYDGTATTQLTDHYSNTLYPHICGSRVAWFAQYGLDNEIFFYDGTTTTQLTNDTSFDQMYPRVSESLVVWRQSTGGAGETCEMFLYDGQTITQLTDNDTWDGDHDVSGSIAVWKGYGDGSDSEIFMAIPEPASFAFAGLGGLALLRRKRR